MEAYIYWIVFIKKKLLRIFDNIKYLFEKYWLESYVIYGEKERMWKKKWSSSTIN